MKRYTIMVRPSGVDYEVALADVDSNPEAIVKAVKAKRRRARLTRYENVRIRENEEQAGVQK